MPYIGIVDDREVHRTTVAKNIGLELEKIEKTSWGYKDRFPFSTPDDYLTWIQEEDISALVIDERLHEEAASNGVCVDYNGHDLAAFLRTRIPEYPIYVVTSHRDDADLLDTQANIEGIIGRNEFNEKPENYVPRIVRAAQRFFDQYQSELETIAELSKKIAMGEAVEEDASKLSALQTKIGLGSSFEGYFEKSQVLDELATELDKLSSLKDKIEQYLQEK